MRTVIFLFLLFSVMAAADAAADVIVLKNGRKIQANEVWEENGNVKCRRYGAEVVYPSDTVLRIEKTESSSDAERDAYIRACSAMETLCNDGSRENIEKTSDILKTAAETIGSSGNTSEETQKKYNRYMRISERYSQSGTDMRMAVIYTGLALKAVWEQSLTERGSSVYMMPDEQLTDCK